MSPEQMIKCYLFMSVPCSSGKCVSNCRACEAPLSWGIWLSNSGIRHRAARISALDSEAETKLVQVQVHCSPDHPGDNELTHHIPTHHWFR